MTGGASFPLDRIYRRPSQNELSQSVLGRLLTEIWGTHVDRSNMPDGLQEQITAAIDAYKRHEPYLLDAALKRMMQLDRPLNRIMLAHPWRHWLGLANGELRDEALPPQMAIRILVLAHKPLPPMPSSN